MPESATPDFPPVPGPPRRLALLGRVRMLLGGALAQISWLLFGFGMIFFWGFVLQADLGGWKFQPPLAQAQGTIAECTTGHGSVNETEIYGHRYSFTHAGRQYEGISYETGVATNVGDLVTIEYRVDEPTRSRIQGMRSAPFSGWLALIGLFPAAALGMLIYATRNNWRAVWLLVHGETAPGKLVGREKTNVEINDQPLFKYTYEFADPAGENFTAEVRTTRREGMKKGKEETIFYDPAQPRRNLVATEAPGFVSIDEQGEIHTDGFWPFLRVYILPALTVGGHLLYVLKRWT